jgi:tRNA-splicing endonuclease subunit Sen34
MTILLRIAHQTAYVWDVDDIAAIRTTHRICGILSGTLPHLSQQNVFLGLPLTLMPEEVVLLVEIGTPSNS